MAVFLIAIGVGMVLLDVYLYVGSVPLWVKGALTAGIHSNAIFGLIPGGIGSVMLGIGFLAGDGQYGLGAFLMVAGIGLYLVAIVLWFWGPWWSRPPFMRIGWYDAGATGPPPPEYFWPRRRRE